MSDESTQLNRKPTDAERHLITVLVAKASDLSLPTGWLDSLVVQPMNDGGMGSLRLISFSVPVTARTFGKQASELIFDDVDGVQVIASLNLDSLGLPMELDLWKSDFSPLVRIPADLAAS